MSATVRRAYVRCGSEVSTRRPTSVCPSSRGSMRLGDLLGWVVPIAASVRNSSDSTNRGHRLVSI